MQTILHILIGALGAVLGSFAGVISERLHTGESWIQGRSKCNSCARVLSSVDLIPVLSWVSTRGRCRGCRASVPYRYAIIEALLALLFYGGARLVGFTPELPFLLISFFILAIVVLYDLRHTIVPLNLALLLIATSGIYAWLHAANIHAFGIAVFTAGIIASGFAFLHFVSRGRWMGLGDAPIALALSLLAGGSAISGLLFSFWIGGAFGIIVLVTAPKGHRIGIEVPFVPFLAAGYLLALFTQWNPFIL
ncbi:MAG: prepilin peptidase [Bacillota bacterium]